MKKAKVVTYCTWTSIGSMLQSYALKIVLTKEECNSSIILKNSDNQFEKIKVHSFKSLIKRIFELLNGKKKNELYKKRMRFLEKYISVEGFENYSDIQSNSDNDDTDIYIAGSDQVWNPDNCNPLFFLDFVQKKKCISYAASMGKSQIPDDKAKIIEKYLKKFEFISVREQSCADALKPLTDKEITVNIDPTFLIDCDEWRNISRKYESYKLKKSYILLYMLYWDNSCKKKIKELKKKTGMPIYAISNGLSGVYADKVFYDVGVEEFLWLVDNAEYVVTSSFHGVALSIIFNKKFSAVINPSMPARIESVMKLLSVPKVEIADLSETDLFDYNKINKSISNEHERSIEYLRKAMN